MYEKDALFFFIIAILMFVTAIIELIAGHLQVASLWMGTAVVSSLMGVVLLKIGRKEGNPNDS